MPLTFEILSNINSLRQLLSIKLHASEDTRSRACVAFYFQSLSQSEVTLLFGASQSSLSRWLNQAINPDLWGHTNANEPAL
ncbi:hypothetical protein P9112_006361 [Eukaryota sp. TZLM1-RC]